MSRERLEADRIIPAEPAAIFDILRSPQGHMSIDSTGMPMSAVGEPATKIGRCTGSGRPDRSVPAGVEPGGRQSRSDCVSMRAA